MKKDWIYWIISLLLSVVCIYVNHNYFLVTEMIQLEFSSIAEEMHKHIMAVGCSPECCYHTLKMNTIVDYGFLVSYSLLTYFSFTLFLDVFQLSAKAWWVYILSFGAGVMDAVENYFLLTTAVSQHEEFSLIFFWSVRIKWAFAIVPMLLIPMIILYGLILLLKAKQLS
jgi:hypothetical protein